MRYVTLSLTATTATANDTAIILKATGTTVSAANLFVPFSAIFLPPAGAKICQIITPDSFFFTPGSQQMDERCWQRRDELTAVDASVQGTLGIYSYMQQSVTVRVSF